MCILHSSVAAVAAVGNIAVADKAFQDFAAVDKVFQDFAVADKVSLDVVEKAFRVVSQGSELFGEIEKADMAAVLYS